MNSEYALKIAKDAHKDQLDKAGYPYFSHIERVVANTRKIIERFPVNYFTPNEIDEMLQIAALHDVIEDTNITAEQLNVLGFSPNVIKAVKRLTNTGRDETYIENIMNMVNEKNIFVIIVKLADNQDNSDPTRIAQLPEGLRSIANRYDRSMKLLNRAIESYIELIRGVDEDILR